MEIAIVIDRILILVPSIGSRMGLSDLLKIKRPYLILITICTLSLFVNLPYFFSTNQMIVITLVNYGYPGYQVYTIYSNTRIPWSAWGNPGYFFMISIYILKNGVTFFVETALNVTSLILFLRHLTQKNRLMNEMGIVRRATRLAASTNNSLHHLSNMRRNSAVNNLLSTPGGRNMANFVLTVSITGFIHNVLLVTFTVYYSIMPKPSLTMRALQFTAYFASTLRHAINFIQFYFFNKSFRKEVRLLVKKSSFFNTANRIDPI
jgi:hypothetical protein